MKTLQHPVSIIQAERPTAPADLLELLLQGRHGDPHAILGAHEMDHGGKRAIVIRVYDPHARSVQCVFSGTQQVVDAQELLPGYFECAFHSDAPLPVRYLLRIESLHGQRWETEDPYSFLPTVADADLQLFTAGNHPEAFRMLGAHVREVDGVRGTAFAVWAPTAARASVVGDFNQWDGRCHAMRALSQSGVWELFIPRIGDGTLYKFELRTKEGMMRIKTDPYGFGFELRPSNAAVVCALDGYAWNDDAWLERRRSAKWLEEPINIYEVHLGSWMQDAGRKEKFLNYRELAPKLADYAVDMGYTHVELMPVMEHPYDGSWGYQVTGYFGVTRRYGSPSDFMYFVDHLHQKGIGVIMDWVPAHFPRDDWALARFDGTALYEHQDWRLGEHKDWGTYIFNYGRPEVKNFLVSNALFWVEQYHIDGLRVDAVASMLYLDYSRKEGEWIPNRYGGRENLEAIELLKQINIVMHERNPGAITIAEESTSWPLVTKPTYVGGLGFDFKWNMGWMNDFLEYMKLDPIHRKYHHHKITFAMMYAYSENFILVLSHDEVVHGKASLQGKMPGDEWRRFAQLRLALFFMYAMPGKKLIFMGGEFGQYQEWWEAESIHWHLLQYDLHRQAHHFVRDLNHLYLQQPCMHEVDFSWQGFQWIDCNDSDHSVVSFVRRAREADDFLVFIFNFTPVVREGWKFGVPRDGRYDELLNSDAAAYGGSNVGNGGRVVAQDVPAHGQPFSVTLTLPPFGALVFKPDPSTWTQLPEALEENAPAVDESAAGV